MTTTRRRLAAAAAAVLGGLVLVLAGSWFVVERGVQRVLEREAVHLAENWAGTLGSELPRVERLIDGYPASREQIRFIRQMSALADVFRWRLFDETGTLTFDTRYFDELAAGWKMPAEAALGERASWPGAGDAWPRAYVEDGDGERTPRYYAVAFDRLVADGSEIGTLEVFIDQTEHRADLLETLLASGIVLTLLVVLAFLVPVAGLLWQIRVRAAADAAREHAATHDGLTGLLNRHAFGAVIDGKIAREPGVPFHLHAFNIRRFRQVNEALGYAAGDEVIRGVARRLGEQAGARCAVCRLGSDEFALVDATRPGLHEARALAEACLHEVSQPLPVGEGAHSPLIDCGIAQYPGDGTDAATLLTNASLALKTAAAEEGASIRVFHPSMERERARLLEVERRLRRAIEEGDFRLVFQPFFRPDGTLVGCEALLRLDCPEGRSMSPGEFIPIAERTRLIIPLGAQVLRRACTIAARWPDDLILAVNFSPVEFEADGPVKAVRRALATSGLPAHRLEIEVTESTLITNPDLVALQLDEIKEMGVRLALDDFGTGYSNLGQVSKYPFDRLKIDRSFVTALTEGDPQSGHMLHIIVAIGELLGLDITAEGVETAEQARQVARIGVDCVQGFRYSMPLDVEELERLLRQSASAAAAPSLGGVAAGRGS
ncbi:MAG TPA: EAL domain-containing protein [Thermohalobaculum sp.]|nr:EAL domain-containing protein [Thermohalobaculum sp.]